ncbi:MAG: hypothetical protein IME96_04060 [Proteobacteria bacterium]|nr:hypothetical protein [Pseudomonadota bacterium]
MQDGGKTNYYSSVRDSGIDGNYYGIGKWCGQCHDKWHEETETSNKLVIGANFGTWDYRHWRRHPVNTPVPRNAVPKSNGDQCAVGCHGSFLNRTNYTTNLTISGKAIPVTAMGNNYYPNGQVYYLPNCDEYPGFGCGPEGTMSDWPNDPGPPRVFCLTCHFAHGGPYYDAIRWDYLFAVSAGDGKMVDVVRV